MSRSGRVAVTALAGLAAVLVGGQAPAGAQEDQKVDVRLPYTCGEHTVEVQVTATFPAGGTVGEPISPTDPAVAVTVPGAVLAALPDAATVTSVLRLDTAVTQGATAEQATWSAVQGEPAPVVEEVVLGAPAEAPPVTVTTAGEVAFTAGALTVTITGQHADGTVTEPPSVELACVVDPTSDAGLATVPVTEAAAPPSRGELPAPDIQVGSEEKAEGAPIVALGPVPPECHVIEPPPNQVSTTAYCANLTGYTNVEKLHASVFQPPGIVNISAGRIVLRCEGNANLACQVATIQPDLAGRPDLPVATASFLPFGFVPAVGSMQLTQVGLANASLRFTSRPPYTGEAVVTVKLVARILEASVNGVPVDVGPDCRTSVPIDAVLTANYPAYSITEGGVLSGTVTIPPFSGCGVTEDLDPVFTGLVSGPGNYVKMTQGLICTINSGYRCPPEVPEAER